MATDSTRHIFPFFDLPAELRDMVYDESLTNHTDLSDLQVEAKDIARPNLLLVSKQFKTELEQRVRKHSQLLIKTVGSLRRYWKDPRKFVQPIVPQPAAKARNLTVHVAIEWLSETELKEIHTGITLLLPMMRNLKSLKIRIMTNIINDDDDEDGVNAWQQVLSEQEWNRFAALESLRLVAADRHRFFQTVDLKAKSKLVMEWSKKTDEFEERRDGEVEQDKVEDGIKYDTRMLVFKRSVAPPLRRSSF